MPEQLDRGQIVACYRAMLGREPESETVIQSRLDSGMTLEVLINSILQSPEYLNKLKKVQFNPRQHLNVSTPVDIQVTGQPKQMQVLLNHMKNVWTTYGTKDPYYSVLTNEIYKSSVIDEKSIESFYKEGLNHFNLINKIINKNSIFIRNEHTILDFGCGLGRVGSHFALMCEHYIGVDISKPHLTQAKMYFNSIGIANYEFMLLEKFLKLQEIADLIFSVIVLQHNPPPVIGYLIDQMCRALKPGGTLLFQVPTSLAAYKFDLKNYLTNLPSEGIMEMHAFPQKEVFKIFRNHGLQPVEVFEHDMIGPIGESTIFVAVKDI